MTPFQWSRAVDVAFQTQNHLIFQVPTTEQQFVMEVNSAVLLQYQT